MFFSSSHSYKHNFIVYIGWFISGLLITLLVSCTTPKPD